MLAVTWPMIYAAGNQSILTGSRKKTKLHNLLTSREARKAFFGTPFLLEDSYWLVAVAFLFVTHSLRCGLEECRQLRWLFNTSKKLRESGYSFAANRYLVHTLHLMLAFLRLTLMRSFGPRASVRVRRFHLRYRQFRERCSRLI